MQVHDFILIAQFLSQLEQKAHFQRAVLKALFGLCLSFLVLASCVQTAGLVYIDLLVLLAALDELIVDLHGLPIFTTKTLVSPQFVKDKEKRIIIRKCETIISHTENEDNSLLLIRLTYA